MKMNKIFTMTLAAVTMVGLASCNKNEDGAGKNYGENQSLTIFIGQPEMENGTRSIGASEAGKTAPVIFADGELFLCDVGGIIKDIYTFGASTNLGTKVIGITAATTGTGVTLTNVSGEVKNAYIVGNSSKITAPAYTANKVVGMKISDIKGVVLTPAMQFNATKKSLEDVTLFGEGTLGNDPNENSGLDNSKKWVDITLYPLVARLEIADIKAVATGDATPVNVTKYNVEGIYINNHYPTMTIGGTAGTLVNPGQGGASVYGNGVAPYTTLGILHDYSATFFGNTVTNLTKFPNGTNNTNVWGYNLFASKTAATTVAPHIIVAINGVEASNGQDYSGMKFLTVNKLFKKTDGTEIKHFQAGKIYQIEAGDFQFTVKHTHTEAEIGEIQLRVKVGMITWTTESMKPGLQ